MSHIEAVRVGHVLEIKVNRPEKLNAFSPEMYADLALALGKLDREPELRAGLVFAEGKHFSAGVELDRWAAILANAQGFPVPPEGIDPFGVTGRRCQKPLVMAVQGYCYTWGVEFMLTTDARVAADDARFGMLEVRRGIFPCGGATFRLPQQMGWANAQRYLLTGDTWSAAEAFRTGLVQEIVKPGEQCDAARAIARRMAAGAPLGVRAILKSSRLTLEAERRAAAHVFDDLPAVMRSEDAQEGVRSFLERRDAVFAGR